MRQVDISKIRRSRIVKDLDKAIDVELTKLSSLAVKSNTTLYFEGVELNAADAHKCISWGGLVGLIEHTNKMVDTFHEMYKATEGTAIHTGMFHNIYICKNPCQFRDFEAPEYITALTHFDWANDKAESFGGSRYSKIQAYVRMVSLYSEVERMISKAVNQAREEMRVRAERTEELARYNETVAEVKEDTKMKEENTVKAVKTVAEEIDELLSNSETVVNKEDSNMNELTLNENEMTWLADHSADVDDVSYKVVSVDADQFVKDISTEELVYSWRACGSGCSLLDCSNYNEIPDEYNIVRIGNKVLEVYSEMIDLDSESTDNNSVTEIVTEYETDNVNDVEVAAICEDGTVEVLRPIIKKKQEACEFNGKSKAPDIVKNKSDVVVTADDLRAELRQLQDLEEHEVPDVLAHKIIETRLDILITQEGGVYKAQALDKKAVLQLLRMFGCFKLENKAINRLSMEKKYFDMVAANTTHTDGSKHRAKLLDYLSTCTMDMDGWLLDHLGRRWINPLTGALAEGITAGDNYTKGGRWFTVLPNGEACSFPDYWVSVGWLALFYKTRLSWDGLVYWFTSGTTEVNHKNGNRLECALDNLELVHSWDNSRHAAFMRMFAGCGFFNSRWIEYSMKDGRAGAGHWEMDFGVSAQLVGLEFNRCRTYTKAPKLNKEKAWDSWTLCGHHELNNVKNNIWQEAEEAYYKRRDIAC